MERPRPVAILGFPDVQLLDVCGPLQVFASANREAATTGRPQPYALSVIATGTSIVSSAGVTLSSEPLPPPHRPLDTLILAGGSGVDAAVSDGGLVAWVAAQAKTTRRTASVCTGAFLLAAAGLVDDRRVATHWSRCAELAHRFPAARVEPDPIFVTDGPIWSSAGVTAGIDLALALVEADEGHALALAVARQLVVFLKRPGGQAQFSTTLALQAGTERFARLHAWMADHLDRDLTVGMLAEQAGMSERSFARHYRQATGRTPARAVEELRVEAAQRMLGAPGPVKRVAVRCGFGSEETLRRSFLRLRGTTPQDHRDRFARGTAGG